MDNDLFSLCHAGGDGWAATQLAKSVPNVQVRLLLNGISNTKP